MSGEKKYKLTFIFIFCFFTFSIFSLPFPLQSYYAPGPYSYYSPPTNYSLPPINININLGGFPGSYATGYPNYMGYSPSGYIGGTSLYGNPWMGFIPPTPQWPISTERFAFIHATVDGDYIYLLFGEARGRNRWGLAIFEASGSDEYEYLSHITLYEPVVSVANPAPREIIVKGDLAVIGGDDQGMVYLVDISEKDDPELINKLILGAADDSASDRVTGLAIEDDVLFVGVPLFDENESIIFAVDISDPEDTDEDDDLLDTYTIDDYDISGMVSSPGYLYIVGKDRGYPDGENEEGATILIMDVSDPDHLSLEEDFDDLDDSSLGEPDELSIEIAGDYLFVTCGDSSVSKLRIIDISEPDDPDLISSSQKMTGTQIFGNRYICVKDDYAYVLASDTSTKESRIYVYDIFDPADPDLVETKNLSGGSGYELHLAGDRLFLHIVNQGVMKLIDISEPEDLSLEGTVDLAEILEEEEALDGWGYTGYTVPSYVYGGYPPYGYFYTPPPSYTTYIPMGYNTPYRTSSGGLWNSPNYYGYAQPLYGGNFNFAPGFSFNYGQPPYYGGYPNYAPVPGAGYAIPPYYSGWRRF